VSPYASVVIPTHDRASTLPAAVASVQRQTVSDLEIIIAGDGVTPKVRAIAKGLASSDRRVRFIDAPKAPHRGGPNRDWAVRSARAERIFYTDDDDLWMSSHVATLGPLLDRADIADTLVASVGISGRLHVLVVDNSDVRHREQVAAGRGKTVFDTHLAHRKSAYLGLEASWSDGNLPRLFSAFARSPAVRWESRGVVTALSLHGAPRSRMRPKERRSEIERWSAQLEALERAPALSAASPAWWSFRFVSSVGRPLPIREGFAALTTDQARARALSLALARGQPCPPEVERLLPFFLDRVVTGPSYPDLAAALVSALGPDRARRAVQHLYEGDDVFSEHARFLAAHILVRCGRSTEGEELLLVDDATNDHQLNARQLQLRAQLHSTSNPLAAAGFARRAAQLMPQDRHGWQLAFDYCLRAGEVNGAQDSLQRFTALILDDDGHAPGKRAQLLAKRAQLLAKRDQMESKLTKLRRRNP
jgi:hypothetical protein